VIVGEVLKLYTFYYKTKKSKKDELFCVRNFRPIKMGFVLVIII
jgi:hypothetical protein